MGYQSASVCRVRSRKKLTLQAPVWNKYWLSRDRKWATCKRLFERRSFVSRGSLHHHHHHISAFSLLVVLSLFICCLVGRDAIDLAFCCHGKRETALEKQLSQQQQQQHNLQPKRHCLSFFTKEIYQFQWGKQPLVSRPDWMVLSSSFQPENCC